MKILCSRESSILVLAGGIALLVPAAVRAGEPLHPLRAVTPPLIDGRLDDDVWRQAPTVDGFKTWLPDFGADMKDRTVVSYAYDAENMYFAFRAYDSEPSKIKASMANRDSVRPDDWICINLDSFNDQQALYAFYVNPLGIHMDSRFAANREDMGFDAVWYSAGVIDDRGYAIEVRIPFKSLRYGGKNPVTMGVIFERFVSRRREDGTYAPLDPKSGFNFQIQMLPIQFADIKRYTLLEVLPDAVYNRQDAAVSGRLERLSSGPEAGLTVKYGLTAQLTVDGTYNPDFSQVESDAGQIDINRRSPLFFPEKRPFFLEGQDVFTVGGPSQTGPLEFVVHTRNIVNPLAGVKLSGKLARADTVTVLYAPDEGPVGPSPEGAPDGYTHFEVVRYKRSLNQDSYLGGFYVGREHDDTFNRVAGADGTVRLSQSDALGFYAFESSTRAPGADSAAAGHAIAADFNHDTRNLTAYLSAVDISPDFAAESGYVTRTGLTSLAVNIIPKLYPKRGIVRRVSLTGGFAPTRDTLSGLWETNASGAVGLTFRGATTASAGYHQSTEVFLGQRFPTSGVAAAVGTQVTKELRLQGTFTHGQAIYYPGPWSGRSTGASAAAVYQPSDRWSETLTFTYANFDYPAAATRLYDYLIGRSRTTFQLNRFLFFRGIIEYNSFRRQLVTDLLASFTYIPGTVLHAGYGSLYERTRWDGAGYVPGPSLREIRRGLFLKASYLWRL
jgi:hypothetical protein